MKPNRVASIALTASVLTLLGCSPTEKVVAANVQSSNDNEYNPTTNNGRKGGLIKPGIPDGILHPGSTNPDQLRAATKVRISLSQDGQSPITREVVPNTHAWSFDVLDAAGNPEKDVSGKTVKEEHLGITQFFERITLTDGWRGVANASAEAIDDAGEVLLSASVRFTVEADGAVYVPIDLTIPSAPSAAAAAGAAGATGAAGAAGSAGASVELSYGGTAGFSTTVVAGAAATAQGGADGGAGP